MVLGPPTLDEAHPYCTHLGEFIYSFKTMVDRLAEQGGKLLVVEDLQAAAWRNFADGGGMKSVVVIAVTTLDKYTRVTQTLCKHLSSHVIQVYTYKTSWNKTYSMYICFLITHNLPMITM
jgi:hypothetical protein